MSTQCQLFGKSVKKKGRIKVTVGAPRKRDRTSIWKQARLIGLTTDRRRGIRGETGIYHKGGNRTTERSADGEGKKEKTCEGGKAQYGGGRNLRKGEPSREVETKGGIP